MPFPVRPGTVQYFSRNLGLDVFPRFKQVRLRLTASYSVIDSTGFTTGSGSCSGETVAPRWPTPTAGEEIGTHGPGTALRLNGGGLYTWRAPLGMAGAEITGSLLPPGSSTSEAWVIRPGVLLTISPAVTTAPSAGHQDPMRAAADALTVALTDASAVGLYYGPAAFTGPSSGSDSTETYTRYWTPAAPITTPIKDLPGSTHTLLTVGGYSVSRHPPGGTSSTQEASYSLSLEVTFQ